MFCAWFHSVHSSPIDVIIIDSTYWQTVCITRAKYVQKVSENQTEEKKTPAIKVPAKEKVG